MDATIDVRPVMAGRRRKEAHAVLDRAALGIGGAEVSRRMRANDIAAAHMVQGSSVT